MRETVREKLHHYSIRGVIILLSVVFLISSALIVMQGFYVESDNAASIANGVGLFLQTNQEVENLDTLAAAIRQYSQQQRRFIYVFDKSGVQKINLSNHRDAFSKKAIENIQRTMQDGKIRKISVLVYGIDKRIFQINPWLKNGELIGAILTEYHEENTRESVLLYMTFLGMVLAGIGWFAVFIHQKQANRDYVIPIQELIDGIHQIESQKEQYRFPTTRKDEFGQIAVAYNALMDTLDSTQKRLRKEIEQLQKANFELEKFEELKIVANFSSVLLSIPDIDNVMQTSLKKICPIFEARGGAVVLMDLETKTMKKRLNYGLSEEYQKLVDLREPIPVSNGYVGEVFKTGIPLVIKNVFTDSQFESWREVAKKGKYIGFICVPLVAQNQKLGVVNLYFDNEINLKERELKLLSILSDQMSIAILRTQYEDNLKVRAKQMTTLHEFSQRIGSNLRLDTTLDIVLKEVAELLNLDYAVVRLLLQDGHELGIAATYGISDEEKKKLPILHVGLGVAGEVAQTGKPVYVNDVHKDIRLRGYTLLKDQETYLGVPLKAGDRVIGVLCCMTTKPRVFTQEEIEYLSVMAAEAGIAIENARLYSETKEMTMIDALTQLYNVRRLHPQLEDEITRAERYNRFISFIMIDIDHFKKYNDTHGHQRGDVVLQKVAQLIKQQVRDIDQVYRYGGEELCIVLPETDKGTAYQVADRVRLVIAEYPFYEEETQPNRNVTISAGVATYPMDAISKEGLIFRADKALYRAKAQGRNRVCVYEEETQFGLVAK